jgi:ribonuclease E
LYSDQDLILQVLRDSLDSSIQEVLVDDDEAFEKVQAYMRTFMPRAKTRLVRYAERMPLFSRFQLEEQIDRIYQQRVELDSGASIVIERTEALTAVDVNSGRATKAGSQEETAAAINLEAAREVARQLRLRDIGGLVVVDFIDMRSSKHQREVERSVREAMKDDKARFSVGRISPNGLMEINRQRIKKELQLRTHRECPTCGGTGSIASSELVGLNLLRRIETRAVTGRIKRVRVGLHPELAALEREFDIRVEIIAAAGLHRSEERIEWFERDQNDQREPSAPAVTVADLADGAGPSGDAPAEETGDKPRRRRRGGRKRRKAPAASAEQPVATDAAADQAEAAAPKEDSGTERPKRRRPRRRRKKKPTDEAKG